MYIYIILFGKIIKRRTKRVTKDIVK